LRLVESKTLLALAAAAFLPLPVPPPTRRRMLAGLLFATHDALDRPDALTATLPFGGTTLIEFQARTLVELGASQIVIIVSRLTPELLGAIGRIGRRGVAVDPVRSAAEASEKLHPLARLLVLADGLITSTEMVEPLASEGVDALLVVEENAAPAAFERVGGNAAWAGVARLAPARIDDVARLPRDYDMQSALLRVAEQARAVHLLLPRGALAHGHGIEHRAAAIADHGRAILVASVAHRTAWFDRWLVAPIARLTLPRLVERAAPSLALASGAAVAGVGGVAAMLMGHTAIGLLLLLLAAFPLALGTTLSRLRDETAIARAQDIATAVLAAVGALLLGRAVDGGSARPGASIVAVGLVIAAALGARAALPRLRRRWWATPPAYLAVLLPFVAFGWPALGLAVGAAYAAATLAAAVEALRGEA